MFEILINKNSFSVEHGCITGAEIKSIGTIPKNDKVTFHIRGAKHPIEINDNDVVDLKHPGAAVFSTLH